MATTVGVGQPVAAVAAAVAVPSPGAPAAYAVPVAAAAGGGPAPKGPVYAVEAVDRPPLKAPLRAQTDVVVVQALPASGPPPKRGADSGYTPGVISKLELGLAWDLVTAPGTAPVDLDAMCVLYDFKGERCDVCYYNDRQVARGSVMLSGDNKTGHGDGDDETVKIDLASLPVEVEYLAFLISVHDKDASDSIDHSFDDVKVAGATLRDVSDPSRQGRDPYAQNAAPVLWPQDGRDDMACTGAHKSVVIGLLYKDSSAGGRRASWHFARLAQPLGEARSFEDPAVKTYLQSVVDQKVPPEAKQARLMAPPKKGQQPYSLKKGDDIRLPPECKQITVGLGWEAPGSMDIDSSVIVMQVRARARARVCVPAVCAGCVCRVWAAAAGRRGSGAS
eukprot:SAG22_NODE_3107_length_1934_cov_1.512807_2_plen_391_part_00